MGKRGTRRSWGESRRPTRSASSFSASPSANPVSTRKRTATPACPSPTPVRGGTMCSTCANRSSASARRRPTAACVSTRARQHARWPTAIPAIPIASRDPDTVHEADAMPRTRRFERSAPERRGRFSRGDDHARGARARGADRAARTVAPSDSGDHRAHRGRADAAAPGADRPPSSRAPSDRARGRQARPARAVGRGPGLLPDLCRGDEHVACGHARAQRGRGRRPPRPSAGRSHSHGDAARYPRRAEHRPGRPMMGRPGRVAVIRPAAPRAARNVPPEAPESPAHTSGWRVRAYLM